MNNHDVEAWVQHLTDEDMPVFAGTVTDVTNAVNDGESSAADVAHIILKDASLTGRLLKMANSFYYNPNGQKMNTITRAVMILGFDQVRALALSLILVDSLSEGEHRNKVIEEMAQSFHAAIQAQELAKITKVESPENVFVATLLSRLGNMAFWAFAGDKATQLSELITSGEMSDRDAEKEVLGFHLKDLTKGLSKSWSLGDLLDKSLSDNEKNDPHVQLVAMGHNLAQAAKKGWDEGEAQKAIEIAAQQLNMPVSALQDIAYNNAKQAKTVTRMYGVIEASKRIPIANIKLVDWEETDEPIEANVESKSLEDTSELEQEEVDIATESHPEPDARVQLTILQEITEAIEEKPSINVILEMVLEGLYRGVGMDRSLFAILSRDRKVLTCKYAVGQDDDILSKEFKIDISHTNNVFQQVIRNKKAAHIPADPKEIVGTLTRDTLKFLGTPPYLIMPTIVKGKVIGVFIADRNASKRKIESKDFLSFQQFCQQANMGLTFLSMQG
ncbi:MAG: HDOD domain-containing protein [Methylococcaceae bacterium]|nr:HDOD domain-containing protein [Methylococcaceae bacterium]